jgi:hypothetical protein
MGRKAGHELGGSLAKLQHAPIQAGEKEKMGVITFLFG